MGETTRRQLEDLAATKVEWAMSVLKIVKERDRLRAALEELRELIETRLAMPVPQNERDSVGVFRAVVEAALAEVADDKSASSDDKKESG